MGENATEKLEKKISELELALQIEQKRYAIIAVYSNCGLWEYDIETGCLDQSRKLDGKWSDANLIIENYRDTVKSWGIIYPEDLPLFEQYCDYMDHGEPEFEIDLRAICDESRYIWLRYNGTTIFDKDGRPKKVVGKTLDVTKEKEDLKELTRMATEDPLTHLYNKAFTRECVERVITMPNTKRKKHVLFIIDIDNFKGINDRWGHLFGDSVLTEFASKLSGCFKKSDIVGRIGGDEFLVLGCDVKNDSDIDGMANRILQRAESTYLKEDCTLSVSVGAAVYPRDAQTYDAMYRSADIALYHAKRNGKNCYAVYDKNNNYAESEGETSRKQEGGALEPETSVKNIVRVEKELFDYSFEIINESDDFGLAVSSIFHELCINFKLDYCALIEYNYTLSQAEVVIEWAQNGKDYKKEISETITRYWNEIEGRYQKENRYIYNHSDKEQYEMHNSAVYKNKNIKGMIQFPIFDGTRLAAVVNYEDSHKARNWNYSEIATLSSITKMIGTYMLRISAKEELEEELRYTGKAFDAQKLTYYSVDANDYTLTYVSRYANEIFPNITLGEKCYASVMGKTSPCQDCPIRGLTDECEHYATEIYNDSYDRWLSTSVSRVEKEERKEFLLCWTDVTSFLERVKFTDPLTGTLTYEKFTAKALKMLAEVNHGYALAFLGIHHFSHINDEYGYEVGDEILKEFAERFQTILAEDELICHIKGDDFLLLLDTRKGIDEASDRIHHVFDSIEILRHERYPNMKNALAAGLIALDSDEMSMSAVVDKCNKARKVALETVGESQTIFIYTKEYERLQKEEQDVEKSMAAALRNHEFQVYLQPKVNPVDETIGGAEALVRWIKPDGTVISPGKFIPLFEKNGFVMEVDNYVYESIFAKMAGWLAQGKKVPMISVNASRLHLFDDRFPNYMENLVQKHGIPHELVEIEITESVFFDNIDRLIDMIVKLRDFGFVISMDDFGTGYSTLSLMKSMPIDIMKIDGSFFMRTPLDEKNKAIISSVIHLGKSLGLSIVAEGVETREQMEYAKGEGCDLIQGYYYYKPMPVEEFEKLL